LAVRGLVLISPSGSFGKRSINDSLRLGGEFSFCSKHSTEIYSSTIETGTMRSGLNCSAVESIEPREDRAVELQSSYTNPALISR
jgi:hypothetical protein